MIESTVDETKSIATTEKEDLKDAFGVLDYTVSLLENRGVQVDDWKYKSVALTLSMLALAEVQAKRVSSLARIIDTLESKVFDERSLLQQSPQQLVQLYKIANDSLQKSSEYISDVVAGTDWNKLESELITLQAKKAIDGDNVTSGDSQSIVKVILTELSRVSRKTASITTTTPNNSVIDVVDSNNS